MAGRQSRKQLRILEVLTRRGKGTQVRLDCGRVIWLPTKLVKIQVNDQGERVADMPGWLYDLKKKELAGDHKKQN